ncbi:MAG: phospholipase D-like domain-containing protein [bacterium]|nr:phospholipase D-like domain-containing protein [bacterium]
MFKKIQLIILTGALLSFIPCHKHIGANRTESPLLKDYDSISAYFGPKENLSAQLIKLINLSEKNVYGAFYNLELIKVASALIDAKNRGVKVHLVMDKERINSPGSQYALLSKHINIKVAKQPRGLMHNKFCVFDNKIVWTGSYNPTYNGTYYNNNNVVVINSKVLAEDFIEEFRRISGSLDYKDHRRQTTEEKIVAFFSKKDNCKQKIIQLLNNAEVSICFASFIFTDKDIAKVIISKHNKGIKITGVMEKGMDSFWNMFSFFRHVGIDVKWDKNYSHQMHHKIFLIDKRIIITGSFNPTFSAHKLNWENIIVIQDAKLAAQFMDEIKNL